MSGGTRVLIVQYTGDYRVAYNHLSKGGGETYYAEQFSIDFVAELGREIEQIGVLCLKSHEHYDEVLPNGVRAMGAAWTEGLSIAPVIRLFEEFRPTHLVLGSPRPPLISGACGIVCPSCRCSQIRSTYPPRDCRPRESWLVSHATGCE